MSVIILDDVIGNVPYCMCCSRTLLDAWRLPVRDELYHAAWCTVPVSCSLCQPNWSYHATRKVRFYMSEEEWSEIDTKGLLHSVDTKQTVARHLITKWALDAPFNAECSTPAEITQYHRRLAIAHFLGYVLKETTVASNDWSMAFAALLGFWQNACICPCRRVTANAEHFQLHLQPRVAAQRSLLASVFRAWQYHHDAHADERRELRVRVHDFNSKWRSHSYERRSFRSWVAASANCDLALLGVSRERLRDLREASLIKQLFLAWQLSVQCAKRVLLRLVFAHWSEARDTIAPLLTDAVLEDDLPDSVSVLADESEAADSVVTHAMRVDAARLSRSASVSEVSLCSSDKRELALHPLTPSVMGSEVSVTTSNFTEVLDYKSAIDCLAAFEHLVKKCGGLPGTIILCDVKKRIQIEDGEITMKTVPYVGPTIPSKFPCVNGWKVAFSPTSTATRIGPVIGPAVWFDTVDVRNVLAALQVRTQSKYNLDVSSAVWQRYRRVSAMIRDFWFTPQRIYAALNSFYSVLELKSNSWSVALFLKVAALVFEGMRFDSVGAFLKSEVINKTGKTPRIIINEGHSRTFSNLVVIYIVEYVVFHILERCGEMPNIKYKTKEEFCDEFTKINAEPVCVWKNSERTNVSTTFMEIDQTSFDMSERLSAGSGLLELENGVIRKVIDTLRIIDEAQLACNTLRERVKTSKWEFRTFGDASACIKVRLNSRRRHSGDRGTTSLNYIVEFSATISSIFLEPQVIVKHMALGTYRKWFNGKLNAEGTYPRYPLAHKPPGDKYEAGATSVYAGWFEGDDGAVRLSAHAALNADAIMADYHSLGLDCKVKFAEGWKKPETFEFVGVLFLVSNGMTIERNWSPDPMRALLRSAFSASKAKCIAELGAATYVSKSYAFAGRVDAISEYFGNLAHSHIADCPERSAMRLVHYDQKKCPELLRNQKWDDVFAAIAARREVGMTPSEQIRFLNAAWGNYDAEQDRLFRSLVPSHDSEAAVVHRYLPDAVKRKIVELFR